MEHHLKYSFMEKGTSNLIKVGFLLSLLFIEGCLSKKSNSIFYKDVLGLNIATKSQEYYYKEAGAPNEGFSFEIQSFTSKGGKYILGEGYPVFYDSKQGWNIFSWQPTPFNNENNALDLVLKYDIADSVLKSHINEVKKLVANKGSYISFFYKNEGAYIYSIDCYLLDTINNRLFIIKVST